MVLARENLKLNLDEVSFVVLNMVSEQNEGTSCLELELDSGAGNLLSLLAFFIGGGFAAADKKELKHTALSGLKKPCQASARHGFY